MAIVRLVEWVAEPPKDDLQDCVFCGRQPVMEFTTSLAPFLGFTKRIRLVCRAVGCVGQNATWKFSKGHCARAWNMGQISRRSTIKRAERQKTIITPKA